MAYAQPLKEPIAIVGSGCRFPGDATSPSKLWELLRKPRDVSKRVPENRFNPDGFYHPDGEHHGASNVTKSYFLEQDPRLFDSVFFNITPREAEAIDPQQRILLETVYEALESSGLTLQGLRGTQTSAYVGMMTNDYTDTCARDVESFSQYMATGTSRALISNRLSYFFDWKGPSMTVDTACSSSLTAIHLAIQGLRSGESQVACCAGSNLLLGPDLFIGATSLHMISPSGKSQMWDVSADGYARGEGFGAVFLKTLSKALEDGDRIEALIRETGVNSDGRTKGITLPSPEAQTALIQSTYKNAGLDINKAEDRPQYFEAHGTGTQAGDPREASAISNAFFPSNRENQDGEKLIVGSIKTIIGHTEGCAGIAGVLKAVLAMQHRTIPPNQHFYNLNPSVAASYKHLLVPTTPTAWPSISDDLPLRASVNSFGFGGTNAHAIVETYVPRIHDYGPFGRKNITQVPRALSIREDNLQSQLDFIPVPLVFSANSESTLKSIAENYLHYIENSDVSLNSLAKTLHRHRTAFAIRTSFSGPSRADVIETMRKQLDKARETPGMDIGTRTKFLSESGKPRLLGVFTGQGAQWPTMGKALIKHSLLFLEVMNDLEESLAQLPDAPEWSLKEELMASAVTSRLSEAALSQPLCTAVQVGLVELLKRANISFDFVIGHSSGEIGAAYAAGRISAADAIRIAYYRGVHAKLAGGLKREKGSMIAVGFGFDEAVEFCSSAAMKNRLAVAASNSPGSVTLSGDFEAVEEAKQIFDEKGLFNRVLKVDTAYHSHHMAPCAEAYMSSLRACNIQVHEPQAGCTWISSVHLGASMDNDNMTADLSAVYWRDNMAQTVLFSQALESALDENAGLYDFVIEVGPHAALRGPALQTMKQKYGAESPYSGTLDRKKDDVVAFSDLLGSLYINLGPTGADFTQYASAFTANGHSLSSPPLGSLPTYPWEHKSIHWRESRISKQLRSRPDPPHELLGKRTPDDTDYEPRWRNFLKPEEIPWLSSHRIQNQIVVPGAAYIVMALEAAKALCKDKSVKQIELLGIQILRPISLDESSDGVETLFSLRSNMDALKAGENLISADFCLSAATTSDGSLRAICTGDIRIQLGELDPASFPTRSQDPQYDLLPVNIDRFYKSLDNIGLNYSSSFKGITYAERRMDLATAVISADPNVAISMPVHPSWMDVCIQSMFLAYAAPDDGSLWAAFLPTSVSRIVFSPFAGITTANTGSPVTVETHISEYQPPSPGHVAKIVGDMKIYNTTDAKLEILVEDMTMSSLSQALESDDRHLYMKTLWHKDFTEGVDFEYNSFEDSPQEQRAIEACEKVVQYYLNKFQSELSPKFLSQQGGYLASIINKTSRKPAVPSRAEFHRLMDQFKDNIDMKLVKASGEKVLADSVGLKSTLTTKAKEYTESLYEDMLSQWRSIGLGHTMLRSHLVRVAKQIAHRYPRMRILHLGASRDFIDAVTQSLGSAFASYTVQGNSHGLDKLRAKLGHLDSRVHFNISSAESDASDEDLGRSSIDLIIVEDAYMVQDHVLEEARRLLRPGGYLLLASVTGNFIRVPFITSILNEKDFPTVSPVELERNLRARGFSGIDTIAFDNSEHSQHTWSLIVSQATDALAEFLRAPLYAAPTTLPTIPGNLLILGGTSLPIVKYTQFLQYRLSTYFQGRVIITDSIRKLGADELESVTNVISLTDLDQPVLENLSAETFQSLKLLLENTSTVLWVTCGARANSPCQSAMVGLGRSFLSENPTKSIQFLDLDKVEKRETFVLESFLRLIATTGDSNESDASQRLWTTEPELAVENGSLVIPRLVHDIERNSRINSLRRVVVKNKSTSAHVVEIRKCIENGAANYVARLADTSPSMASAMYCSAIPILHTSDGTPLHLYIGMRQDNTPIASLSLTNASKVEVKDELSVPFILEEIVSAVNVGSFMAQVSSELQADVIADFIPKGKKALILYPSARLARTLERRALECGKNLRCLMIGSAEDGYQSAHCISVPSSISRRELHALLRSNELDLIVQMGSDNEASSRICDTLGRDVVSFDKLKVTSAIASKAIVRAVASSKANHDEQYTPADETTIINANELLSQQPSTRSFVVVDWTADEDIPVRQEPIDFTLFSASKTYLLVGLTGHIGQSICRWMVRNGARFVVMTSRNPETDGLWKEELQREGATIRIEAADAASKQDLARLHTAITQTMPPIGGVANGAMVLSDGLFADMSFESMQKVLKPKVLGSKNLDELFNNQELEFFLMFSSLSAVIGMPGQSNYAAANNYMVGLAEQRKARGVPASVIDIGMVIGIGVIRRSDGGEAGVMENSLRKQNYMPLSERDLHYLLAEAIVAGHGIGSAEIATGLKEIDLSAPTRPVWFNNPRFSHLVGHGDPSQASSTAKNGAEASLKQKIATARGVDEAGKLIEEAFSGYLGSLLKLPVESIAAEAPVIELGIDSLVAVEIRSWFASETGHDIPVLKILSGSTVRQLCSEVCLTLSFEDKPKDESEPGATTPANAAARTAPTTTKPSSIVQSGAVSTDTRSISSTASSLSGRDTPLSDVVSNPPEKLESSEVVRTEAVSLGQSRLYFASQYLEDKTPFNCTTSYSLSGHVDTDKLKNSLATVTRRHEGFRTMFLTNSETGNAMQSILEKAVFQLRILEGVNNTSDIKKEFQRIHSYPFDLESGDTFVCTLLSHSNTSHTIIFGYHHIIMDGVSWQLFLADLARFYNNPKSSLGSDQLPTQPIDFYLKQNSESLSGAYTERLQYWKAEFPTALDPIPLFPFAKVSTRQPLTKYTQRDVVARVDANLVAQIKKAARASRTTSFHFWLATFQAMLYRLLDVKKLCIGIVDANRSDQAFGNTIGFLLEILPVLFRVKPNQSFKELLTATRSKSYAALGRTGVPIEEILKACQVPASTTHTPLFQVVFNYRMGATRTPAIDGIDMRFHDYADAKTPYDLSVSVDEMDDGTGMLTFTTQSHLYDQEGTELLVNTYQHFLKEFSAEATRSVDQIPLFPSTHINKTIELGRGLDVQVKQAGADTLSQMIGTWIAKDPSALAVKDVNGRSMTYEEMSARANAIASALKAAGAKRGSYVCVLLDPTVDTICSILAILRIGAVYIPLDIRSSDERLMDIREELQASILLYHMNTAERAFRLSKSNKDGILLDLSNVPQVTYQKIADGSSLDDIAMVLYTSGSTGKPKGIPLRNRNVRTPIIGMTQRLSLGREVVLQQSGQGFDAAIFQIFIALANGGTIIMGDNRGDPADLATVIERERISFTLFIVSEQHALFKYGFDALKRSTNWRIALCGGEAVTTTLVDKFKSLNRPELRLVNAYGPTEASIISSCAEVPYSVVDFEDFRISVGPALANYGTYIVDHNCNPVPIGWPGELAICGPGVADGYLNRPDLTQAKFKADTISPHRNGPTKSDWARLYLTGDKGKMLQDGSVVILGRIDGDNQIKLRGMRIQLDDVARTLLESSNGIVADATVIVRGDDPASQILIAYVVLDNKAEVEDEQLYLRDLVRCLPLPAYMRPALAVALDSLPYTDRGKLDVLALTRLPLPSLSLDDEEQEDDLTEHETRMKRVWKDVLGEVGASMPIRRDSDFFSVGGNSLLLLRLRAEIKKEFEVDISVAELFQASVLKSLAARLGGTYSTDKVDWEKETEPNPKTIFLPTAEDAVTTKSQESGQISVLLTGATGFQGSEILRQLVDRPDVSRIHCVAIRLDSQRKQKKLKVSSPKIVAHTGDLALPLLGMTEDEAAEVFQTVDVIIHNGAEVSHMKHYQSLRGPNVSSTRELGQLALQYEIPMHYISTGGVANLSGLDEQPEQSLAATPPPADGSMGYISSKWASEVLLEKLSRDFGLRVWIHRPSNVTGDEVPENDIVHSVMRLSKTMKMVPNFTGSQGSFDFIHVETIARQIVEEAIRSALVPGDAVSTQLVFKHQSGETVVPIYLLKEYLGHAATQPFTTVPVQEWVEAAKKQGLDELVATYLLGTKGMIRMPLLKTE
ncbi:putative hybrid NRPS/PKS enzyme [Whalleya microplaca]|nr:putative hybrid NRPS/PKS enzyme [Whalleya microplaca]